MSDASPAPASNPGDPVNAVLIWLLRLEDSTLRGTTASLGDGAGQTRFGITSRWDSALVPSDYFTKPPADALSDALAFYRSQFWDKLKLDAMPMPLAASVLSCAVNCGVGAALQLLDRSGAKLDTFIDLWDYHYLSIVYRRPEDERFLKGWLARCHAIYPNLPGPISP